MARAIVLVLLMACSTEATPGAQLDCDSACAFMYGCGYDTECNHKCEVNSAFSPACKSIYDDFIVCTGVPDETCEGIEVCITAYDLDRRYTEAGCPE